MKKETFLVRRKQQVVILWSETFNRTEMEVINTRRMLARKYRLYIKSIAQDCKKKNCLWNGFKPSAS